MTDKVARVKTIGLRFSISFRDDRHAITDILRRWLPVILVFVLTGTGMVARAGHMLMAGRSGGSPHPLAIQCRHAGGLLGHGPQVGYLLSPTTAVNDYLSDRWRGYLSLDTDTSDIEPVVTRNGRWNSWFLPARNRIPRSANDRQQRFTPLYLFHRSLRC